MSKVVRVSDDLFEKIKVLKIQMKARKRGRPSIWNTDMKDWDIKIVYNPKKKRV